METLSILLVDDQKLLLDSISTSLIFDESKYKYDVSITTSCEDAIEMVKQKDFHIIVLDQVFPGGMYGSEAAVIILSYKPKTRILGMSAFINYEYIFAMKESGAKGFISKLKGQEELKNAIDALHHGKEYYTNDVMEVVNKNQDKKKKYEVVSGKPPLTRRQFTVLELMHQHKPHKQIAELLCIETKTVETHIYNMKIKLEVKSVPELLAVTHGFFNKK